MVSVVVTLVSVIVAVSAVLAVVVVVVAVVVIEGVVAVAAVVIVVVIVVVVVVVALEVVVVVVVSVVVVVGVVVGIVGRLVHLHSRRPSQCFAHPARSCASCTSSSNELVTGASIHILSGIFISYCALTASFTSLGPGSRSMWPSHLYLRLRTAVTRS